MSSSSRLRRVVPPGEGVRFGWFERDLQEWAVVRALVGKADAVYGDGTSVRAWGLDVVISIFS